MLGIYTIPQVFLTQFNSLSSYSLAHLHFPLPSYPDLPVPSYPQSTHKAPARKIQVSSVATHSIASLSESTYCSLVITYSMANIHIELNIHNIYLLGLGSFS